MRQNTFKLMAFNYSNLRYNNYRPFASNPNKKHTPPPLKKTFVLKKFDENPNGPVINKNPVIDHNTNSNTINPIQDITDEINLNLTTSGNLTEINSSINKSLDLPDISTNWDPEINFPKIELKSKLIISKDIQFTEVISNIISRFSIPDCGVLTYLPSDLSGVKTLFFINEEGETIKGIQCYKYYIDINTLLNNKMGKRKFRDFILNPTVNKLKSASEIYRNSFEIKFGSVVSVYHILRGITKSLSDCYRCAYLPHPDLSKEQNNLLLGQKSNVHLYKEGYLGHCVISKAGQYYKVLSHEGSKITTYPPSDINLSEDKIFIHTFRPATRIIPYHDDNGDVVGIERTFIDMNASKLHVLGRDNKFVKSKLAKEVILKSVVRDNDKATIEITAEGSENLDSLAEVIDDWDKYRWVISMSFSNLLKRKFPSRIKELVIVCDNDDNNMSTQRDLIKIVKELVEKNTMKIYLVYPYKGDMNDVLRNEGKEAVLKLFQSKILVTRNSPLFKFNAPLHTIISLINRKNFDDLFELKLYKEALLYSNSVYQRAQCYIKLNMFAEFRQIISEGNLENSKIYLLLGDGYYSKKEYKRALKCYRKINNIKRIGNCYFKLRKYKKAIKYYKKSISEAIPKEELEILTNLSDCFCSIGKYKKAIDCCDRAITLKRSIYSFEDFDFLRDLLEKRAYISYLSRDYVGYLNQIGRIMDTTDTDNIVLKRLIKKAKTFFTPLVPLRRKRQIVLDTEATGLGKNSKITEIGCYEIINYNLTGRTFNVKLNPGTEVGDSAYKITGYSKKMLSVFPTFANICDEFLKFLGNSDLILHGGDFDIKIINYELEILKKPKLKNKYIDTQDMFNSKKTGDKASLDKVCDYYNIDRSLRTKHSAMLDAELTYQIYIKLLKDVEMRNIRKYA